MKTSRHSGNSRVGLSVVMHAQNEGAEQIIVTVSERGK